MRQTSGSVKHTPGPWQYLPHPHRDVDAALCNETTTVAHIKWDRNATKTDKTLIAAAPDLLEACKYIISCAGDGSLSLQTARKYARAAIARATGEEVRA